MPRERQYASAGEKSNPNPLGRGCLPLTLLIGLTVGAGGWIGWLIGDGVGLALGVLAVLAGWIHFIWS